MHLCVSASPRLRVRPFFSGDGEQERGCNVARVNGAMVYIVNVLSVSIRRSGSSALRVHFPPLSCPAVKVDGVLVVSGKNFDDVYAG
jgi:hypothetical protein